jgi:signal peptidase I
MSMLEKVKEKLQWLDPFTYVDRYILPRINPGKNQYVDWVAYIVFAFIFAWVLYTGIGLLLGTAAPIVVVVSPSMEPVYTRGDAIILTAPAANSVHASLVTLDRDSLQEIPFSDFGELSFERKDGRLTASNILFENGESILITTEGSIVVYFSDWRKQPIIHRAVSQVKVGDGSYLLTKGDSINNTTLDQDCGRIANGVPDKNCITLYPIPVSELEGQAAFKIPLIGCVKLWLLDNTISVLRTGRLPSHFNGYC